MRPVYLWRHLSPSLLPAAVGLTAFTALAAAAGDAVASQIRTL